MSNDQHYFCERSLESAELQKQCAITGDALIYERLGIQLTSFRYNYAAREVFRYIIGNSPGWSVYSNAAMVAIRLGDCDGAIELLSNALALWPKNRALARQLIDVLYFTGREELVTVLVPDITSDDPLLFLHKIKEEAIRNNGSHVAQALDEKCKNLSADIINEVFDIVRMYAPDMLKQLKVAETFNRCAGGLPREWAPFVLAAYGFGSICPDKCIDELSLISPEAADSVRCLVERHQLGMPSGVRFGRIGINSKISIVLLYDEVVVKVTWSCDHYYMQRCLNEHIMIGAVLSKFVPKVLDVIVGREVCAILITRIPGMPLAIIEKKPSLVAFDMLVSIVKSVHAAGILHGDLTAWNVLVDDDIPYLVDFGGARFVSDGNFLLDDACLNELRKVFVDCNCSGDWSGGEVRLAGEGA